MPKASLALGIFPLKFLDFARFFRTDFLISTLANPATCSTVTKGM